jgi:glycosyltransferase involved in cell wall biosynthesis
LQPSAREPRVAIIHDWLYTYAGAERVLEQLIECYPAAELFSVIEHVPEQERGFLKGKAVTTTFVNRLPFSRRLYQKYLPFMPAAVEGLDLRRFDIVLSSSSAVAKGVLTEPTQLHICYLQSRGLRYLYDERFAYAPHRLMAPLQDLIMSRLRTWDYVASRRPDFTIANSHFVSRWHRHRYGVESSVIYPPVNLKLFSAAFSAKKEDYYILVSRFEKYKQVPLVIEAFNRIGKRLLVIGSGSDEKRIRRSGARNVEFLGRKGAAEIAPLVGRAAGLVFAGREDFGIAFVEAQAAGTPVIAFGQGGAAEIVRDLRAGAERPTGVLFHEQSVDEVERAVREFEAARHTVSPSDCVANAERFSIDRFKQELKTFVDTRWQAFQAAREPPAVLTPAISTARRAL